MVLSGDISSEFEYSLVCLNAELFPDIEPPIPPNALNWHTWLRFLHTERLAAHFYTIRHKHRNNWPDFVQVEMRQARYAHLLYGDEYLVHISTLLNSFQEKNIQVIILKGWALIFTLYHGDHGHRYCEDIDILIKPTDISEAEQVLDQLGYLGENEVWPGASERYANGRIYELQVTQGYNNRGLVVGLHWGLFHFPSHDPERVKVEPLFDGAQKRIIAEQNAFELSLEDTIVYLCCHADLHHRSQKIILHNYEIALLVKLKENGINWSKVVQRAEEWQHTLSLKRVFEQINEFWPQALPNSVVKYVDEVMPSAREHRIDRLITVCSDNDTLMIGLMFFTLPGWKKKIGFLIENTFPSPKYMRSRYHAKSLPGILISYVIRYLRVILPLFGIKQS